MLIGMIMKNKYLVNFLCLFVLVSFHVQAQKNTENGDITVDKQIKGVLIGGFNLSQVDGDEVYGFNKFGINAGFGGILPLGHRFSLSVEVLYNEKGSFRKYAPSPVDTLENPYYSLKLNYLTAPIMIHFEDRSTWTFGLGFSWSRMVGFKELEFNKAQEWNRPDITYKTKNDFSIIADLRFRIWKHLKLNAQYSYSLARIRARYYDPDPPNIEPWSRNQYNNVITVRLLYYLNEKYLPERVTFKKNKKSKEKKNE
jgi:hypothetical protein